MSKPAKFVSIKSSARTEFIDITGEVQKVLYDNNIKSGICYVYVPHTTAAVTINEGADPSVSRDIVSTLNRIIPKDLDYRHAEGNSDAHIKSSLIGPSLSVFVEEGRLVLGTWQVIFFCEFDGPRHRRVGIKVIEGQ